MGPRRAGPFRMALTAFREDGSINVIVESPRGATSKFKYDLALDRVMLSRPLPSGVIYPHDWGFVPSTRAPDGDPVDAMIVWEGFSYPGILVPCRPIGMLKVEQTNLKSGARERNDRLAVLPVTAPRLDSIATVFDLPERVRAELEQFFLAATFFEKKDVRLLGWDGPEPARAFVRASVI
jgi:inorganic pyrophosphatase